MGVPRARSTKGPQIWDAEPGWYGLMPPKGHRLWDVPRARSTKRPQIWDAEPGWYGLKPPKVTIYGESVMPGARKVPIYGAACPGWGGLKPPKVTIYGERAPRASGPRPAGRSSAGGCPPRPPWRWTPPPPAPSRRLPHPIGRQGNRIFAALLFFLFFRAVVERGVKVDVSPSCGGQCLRHRWGLTGRPELIGVSVQLGYPEQRLSWAVPAHTPAVTWAVRGELRALLR